MNKKTREIESRVESLAEPILSSQGMELVDVEYQRERGGWVLRLYIDRPGGVTLEDCARVSHEVERLLDVEDFIVNPYLLEVSSPGLNRPLRKREDFVRYLNHRVKVRTFSPIDNRRHFTGMLVGIADNLIEVEISEGKVKIPLSNVAKANIQYDFE